MPSHVPIVRCAALAVIACGEAVLVFVPQAIAFWGWLTSQSADWWGAAGQWGGAVGSFAAVVAALWIAKKGARDAARIAEQGAREVAARELRRQRASAMLVHGEFGRVQGHDHVVIVNASQFPVVDAQVIAAKGNPDVPLIPPDNRRWPVYRVLKPGEQVAARPISGSAPDGVYRGFGQLGAYAIVIEFTDIEGYRWRREGEGLPELLA
ncbi:hypothetical protein [Lentzea sp. NPDC060358]|uniref:hypothetical protein n=1 Tax=Lentzea sp. NPDC060358 TaxID=3347103 RepID=UPI0036477181